MVCIDTDMKPKARVTRPHVRERRSDLLIQFAIERSSGIGSIVY